MKKLALLFAVSLIGCSGSKFEDKETYYLRWNDSSFKTTGGRIVDDGDAWVLVNHVEDKLVFKTIRLPKASTAVIAEGKKFTPKVAWEK